MTADEHRRKRHALAAAMSELSEDCYCAGWLIDCEHTLWHLANRGGGKWGVGEVTAEQAADLLRRSREIGGWMAYGHDDDGPRGPQFVRLAEWERRHEASDWVRWMRENNAEGSL